MSKARGLQDKQIKAAVDACRNDRERAMVLLSIKAGLRAKEIAGLQWANVDLEHVFLRLTATKGGKVRLVPIHKDLRASLTALDADRTASPHVFKNRHAKPGEPLTPNAVAVWFRKFYKERLQWSGFSSHSGRRTMITGAARKITEAGGSLVDVMALAGHSNLETTKEYIDANEDAQRRVIDLL